jgi:hypothetical protein
VADLRREAERRFAAGESPAAVVAWIGRATDRPPSRQTILRWYPEARRRAPTPV